MMLGNNNSSTLIAVDHHNGGGGGGSGSGSGEAGTIPGGGGSGGGGFSDEDKARIEVGDSGGGGNRWPRQETLELLRIRSEMEVAFRDSNLKGPLWEEVSRKMSQLGYRRNAKKCKEKFENVYKYHKRTKDGRASKSDGKTYRFFDQLEALEKNPNPNPNPSSLSSPQPQPQPPQLLLPPPPRAPVPPATTVVTAVATIASSTNNNPSIPTHVTVSSVPPPAPAVNPVSFSPSLNNNPLFSTSMSYSHPNPPPALNNPPQGYNSQSSHPNASSSYPSDDQFTSSSTSSDVDIRRRSHKRKRKLKDYFEGMLHSMMEKQEEMHKKFLETLEKRDRDRMIREEAWRVQEMARMNRELDLLNQERAMAAAKDAAIAAFLHKYTGQENIKSPPTPSSNNTPQIQLSLPLPPQNTQLPPPPIPISQTTTPTPPPPALAPPPMPISQITTQTPVLPPPALAQPQPQPPPPAPVPARDSYALALSTRNDNGGENFMTPSSSRWPKTEVEALIKLRANMDLKYQDNCPKGPLWEEISSQMSKLGYNRSSKRCKEKWENINKYFKKVKESNKRRHEDSKTCPYFHQLDALYKEKAKTSSDPNTHNPFQISYPNPIKPETPVPIMVRPEQQWPTQMHESSSAMDDDEDHDSEHFDENDDVVDEEDDDERERETEGGGHEMVTNQRQASMSVATTTAAG